MATSRQPRRQADSNRKSEQQLVFDTHLLSIQIGDTYDERNHVSLFQGDCLDLLRQLPDGAADLVVTSPPYNIGKEYETRVELATYVRQQSQVIQECTRALSERGSICWQVGNYVDRGVIVPLDTILYPVFADLSLKMRNRIIWHFEHGLHCSRRFSGRYETIIWFTKSKDYIFHLDSVRVPQKYPGKRYFKGPKAGEYSCNPLGKNAGDIRAIPNVKHNHVEKTGHPCQFPVELIERLVLSMSDVGSLVVDPFMGVGSTAIAAIRHGRRSAGAEVIPDYVRIALERIGCEAQGTLATRPMGRPVYAPSGRDAVSKSPFRNRTIRQLTC